MKEKSFWITNISDRNVTVGDLYLSIKARTSVNLLDKRHYSFTEEQLVKSLTSGSLFLKKDKLIKRVVPPEKGKTNTIELDSKAIMANRTPSIFEIVQQNYEELQVQDDREKEFQLMAKELEDEEDEPVKKGTK